jgi:hypothetical protein
MYLAQLVNTIHEAVVFEHDTIIHGPRNDTQWSTDPMSHEYMIGMFFSSDPTYGVSVFDNVTADEILIRKNMFWEPFTSEDVFNGYTSGHSNNLVGSSSMGLESRWVLDATEAKVDDLGLSDVFHPTAGSPAVDGATTAGMFGEDFYGSAPCGAAPDVGAVEYRDSLATQPRSQEIARYLELNQ